MRKATFLFSLILAALLTISCGVDKNLKRGEKYLALGEYFDAGNEFKTAYSKTPAKERARRGQIAKKMAFCYERINSTQKAIAAYRNIIRYKQDDGETHLSFARQLMKNGNYKEALAEYKIALDSLPDNPLVHEGIAAAEAAPQLKEAGSRYLDYLSHKLAIHLEHGIYKGLGASWTVRFQKREGQYNNAEGEVADYQPVWLLDGSVYWQNKYLRVSADCTNITNTRYYDYGGILQPGAWAKISIKAKL